MTPDPLAILSIVGVATPDYVMTAMLHGVLIPVRFFTTVQCS